MLSQEITSDKPTDPNSFGQWQKLWFLMSGGNGEERKAVGTVTRYTCCSHPECTRGAGSLMKAMLREGKKIGFPIDVEETLTVCRGTCASGPFVGMPELRLFYSGVRTAEAYDLLYETSVLGHMVFPRLFLNSTNVTDSRVLFDEEEEVLVLIEPGHCLVDAVDYLFRFNARESCGKCFPCRMGVHKVGGLLKSLRQGGAKEADLEALKKVADAMADDSYCHFAAKVTAPLRLAMELKREDMKRHLEKGCGKGELHLEEVDRG